ncbi:MAG: hypothetical protein ACK4UO_19645 [Pseudolabrys sp.]
MHPDIPVAMPPDEFRRFSSRRERLNFGKQQPFSSAMSASSDLFLSRGR